MLKERMDNPSQLVSFFELPFAAADPEHCKGKTSLGIEKPVRGRLVGGA
jgi:hypothetical protein